VEYSDIRAFLRRRGITTAQVTNLQVTEIAGDVLREWSMVRGPWYVTTLTTAADTYAYDYPSGALIVINVHWSPDLGDETVDEFIQETMTGVSQSPHYPSLRVIRNIETTRWRGAFSGTWKDEQGQIILYPTPSAVHNVAVEYRTLATLSDIQANENTLFLDGCMAFAMSKVGFERASTAGWRASRVAVDGRAGLAMMEKGERDMALWRSRLGLGVLNPNGRS